MIIDGQELIDALYEANCDPRSYSGRGMYGDQCVGVALGDTRQVWDIAQTFARAELNVPAPLTDSLGRGIIAYWPSVKWPENAR